ncbi:MAG TPA: redoxin domain-containing protein [Kofleriaceae bacterium]|nr:redoxin domain-containing protein [Kofleriaceae bacterium]
MSEAGPEPGAAASAGEPGTASGDAAGTGATTRPTGAPGPGTSPGAARPVGASPGWLTRIGLAVGRPRWALAIAADRRYAGRSGSDLIAMLAVLLAATQLRWLAAAAWLGGAVDAGLGLRAAMQVLKGALYAEFAALLIGALAVFAIAGRRRNLGRAFDLACVAVLPVVLVQLGATVLAAAADLALPAALSWPLALGWMGALIALAIGPARSAARPPVPPAPALRPGRWIGAAIAAVAALGAAGQVVWIAGNLDLVRPMKSGVEAPAITLPRIGPGGALGDRVTLAASRGKITVLDFWATWCKPCLAAMPRLDRVARSHPDVAVIAVNLDDAAAARALFDQRGYAMTLVADDGDTSQRYSVSTIPHTVILDRRGVVREVAHGSADVAAMVEAIRTAE